ncbi:MAG: hypothetical protein ABW221_12800 [Vicinamibacteria bacterium]
MTTTHSRHALPARFTRALAAAGLLLGLAGCAAPDPKVELEIQGLETYWAIDSPGGNTQFLAPVVRFNVRNKGTRSRRSILASATYRREGETEAWSGAFWKVAPVKDESLAPGASALAMLKPEGQGRYTSTGAPEGMFAHPEWKDVSAEIFLRVDNSNIVSFGTFPIERRIGSKGTTP